MFAAVTELLSYVEGKEVFIVGPEEDEIKGELLVFTGLDNMQEYLLSKGPGVESEIRILHGIVTSAQSLPEDISFRGLQTYILVDDDINVDRGLIITLENDDTESLASIIEDLVLSGGTVTNLQGQDIDNIKILYGYEIDLGLSIDPDNIKDDIIQTGLSILNESKKISAATENLD